MHETNFKHQLKTRVDDRVERDKTDDARWKNVCKMVDARDDRACRACETRTNPDAVGLLRGHRHHIVYRSAGGTDDSSNLCTLCAECHNDEHQHRLSVDGNADEKLTFWRKDAAGVWYVWRQELAVRVWEKD